MRRRPMMRGRRSKYFASYRTPGRVTRTATVGRRSMPAQLSLYRNPFSSQTIHPKIPDGKVYLSSGQKFQAVGTLDRSAATGRTLRNDNIIEMLLFPGANNCLSYVYAQDDNSLRASVVGFGTSHLPLDIANGATTASQADPTQQICSWRTVSCGMILSLVNNASRNEGWFESCRVALCNADQYSFRTIVVNTVNRAVVNATRAEGLVGVENFGNQNMALSPTYVTGKLRDIHKFKFVLNAQGNNHEFIDLAPGNATNNARNFVDTNMDAILVRIHGSADMNILAHIVSNQEIIYDENSPLHRASTRNIASPSAVAQMNRVRPILSATQGSLTSPRSVAGRPRRPINWGSTRKQLFSK